MAERAGETQTADLVSAAQSGTRWTSLSLGITALSQLLQVVLLARFFLQPEDFGTMGIILVIVFFVQNYMDLGFSAALIHRQEASEAELSSLYWLTLAVGVLSCGTVAAAAPLIADFYGVSGLAAMIPVTALGFAMDGVGRQFLILLQRDLNFRAVAGAEIGSALSMLIVALVCALWGFGVWSLVFAHLAKTGVRSGIAIAAGWKRYRPRHRFAWRHLRPFWRFGGFQLGNQTINLLNDRMDQLVISVVSGVGALGFFSLAAQMTSLPARMINPVVTKVSFPLFARIQGDTERVREGYLASLSLVMTVNAPLMIGLAASAPALVRLVLGPDWIGIVPLLQVLSGVGLMRASGNPTGIVALAHGGAGRMCVWSAALLFVSAPLVYLGAVAWGSLGVCLVLLALQFLLVVPGYWFLVRPYTGPCCGRYVLAIFRPLIISCIMGIVVFAIGFAGREIAAQGLVLAAQVVAGALVYGVLCRLVLPGEMRAVLQVLPASRWTQTVMGLLDGPKPRFSGT